MEIGRVWPVHLEGATGQMNGDDLWFMLYPILFLLVIVVCSEG
mgnify:CR=1 FL=1